MFIHDLNKLNILLLMFLFCRRGGRSRQYWSSSKPCVGALHTCFPPSDQTSCKWNQGKSPEPFQRGCYLTEDKGWRPQGRTTLTKCQDCKVDSTDRCCCIWSYFIYKYVCTFSAHIYQMPKQPHTISSILNSSQMSEFLGLSQRLRKPTTAACTCGLDHLVIMQSL